MGRGEPVEDVKGDVGAGMADVAVVVGRDAADVHADLSAGRSRTELLFSPRLRVVQVQVTGCPCSRAIRGGGGRGDSKGSRGERPGGVQEEAVGARRRDQG
jgi:hypothetical protein